MVMVSLELHFVKTNNEAYLIEWTDMIQGIVYKAQLYLCPSILHKSIHFKPSLKKKKKKDVYNQSHAEP